MSIHRSLKTSGSLARARNVWTRSERLAALKKKGEYKDGETVYGLRKVRTIFKARKAKVAASSAKTAAPADAAAEAAAEG